MCAHFQPLISKLQPCIHSMNTPLLPFPSLSASQLNEVNKLERLLPSPTPSLLLLLSPSSRPPPRFCTPKPALPHLPSPPSFISAETLSSSSPHLFFFFFNCHCCAPKALGFPPSISQDRAAITAQERRRPAVQGGKQGAEETKDEGAPQRRGNETDFTPIFPLTSKQKHTFGPHGCTRQGRHDQTGITTHHNE